MYIYTCDLTASLLNTAHKTCKKGKNIGCFDCTQVTSYNQAFFFFLRKKKGKQTCTVPYSDLRNIGR